MALAWLAAVSACKKESLRNELTVAAATSLREVMPELARAYEASHPGLHVSATYAASGELRRQVEAGAPVDVVLFAGPGPVDDLVTEGHAERASRRVVASNEMVLVGPKGGPPLTFATLTTLPSDEKLAVGDPHTVPAGEYAREYLTTLGEWEALQNRVVLGANVAAVLVYARRGEVSAAIVYRTELRGAPDLVVLDQARGAGAPHPEVVGAVVQGGRPGAADFLGFVASPAGQAVLASFGFGSP
jgi:molybdate transport system substrate-binding protein